MDTFRTNIYETVLITCLIVAAIMFFFIFLTFRMQVKVHKRNRLKTFAEVSARDIERKRIAVDLHDELGPMLSAVKLIINTIETGPKNEEVIRIVSKYIDDALLRIKEITKDLMPDILLRKGVVIAIEEFINNTKSAGETKIDFNYKLVPELSESKAINLYRIILELITNTRKHAKASQLNLELFASGKTLVLTSRDNGIGFDYPATINNAKSFGLLNLASRTEIMSGEMFIESKKGKGTQYTFEIPLS